ncbi:hypothetical protein BJ912DRAFT_1048732 [Pholiota molesta]|nr:hypothetical protein BJ912DRAFT_1048732 [Pholiota molesta]
MLEADATRWRRTTHRLSHMIWMIIAPELIICWAMRQWVGARTLTKKYQAQPKWTMTHGYFLQMGGFVYEGKGKERDIISTGRLEGFLGYKTNQGPFILSAKRLEQKPQKFALPNITAKEINDRSKRDGLSKTIAIGQTTWFLAQCLTRKAQGLVTTELELVTVAFAALNVFIYFFWWDKPMDVGTTVMVVRDLTSGAEEYGSYQSPPTNSTDQKPMAGGNLKRTPTTYNKIKTFVQFINDSHVFSILSFLTLFRGLFERVGSMLLESPDIKSGTKQISKFYALDASEEEKFTILACAGFIGVLFGGIHCVGWNYFFPSHAEVILWRVSSIAITGVPALVALGAFAFYAEETSGSKMVKKYCGILGAILLSLGAVGLIPYIVARIVLLVEAFVSLRDLPPDALLAVRWTSFLPHL